MRSPPVAVMPEKLSKSYWDIYDAAAVAIVLAKQYIRVQNSSRTLAKDITGLSVYMESEYFVYRNPIISTSTHIATIIILCDQQFELIELIEQIFNPKSQRLRGVGVIDDIKNGAFSL